MLQILHRSTSIGGYSRVTVCCSYRLPMQSGSERMERTKLHCSREVCVRTVSVCVCLSVCVWVLWDSNRTQVESQSDFSDPNHPLAAVSLQDSAALCVHNDCDWWDFLTVCWSVGAKPTSSVYTVNPHCNISCIIYLSHSVRIKKFCRHYCASILIWSIYSPVWEFTFAQKCLRS